MNTRGGIMHDPQKEAISSPTKPNQGQLPEIQLWLQEREDVDYLSIEFGFLQYNQPIQRKRSHVDIDYTRIYTPHCEVAIELVPATDNYPTGHGM